jgi:hypothetical protein
MLHLPTLTGRFTDFREGAFNCLRRTNMSRARRGGK